MSFLTSIALSRRPVTLLAILLILGAGMFAFANFDRALFPDVEFPTIIVATAFPNADPQSVERDVTEPIEEAIAGMTGLKDMQSTSAEGLSVVLVNFEFGEDMEEAKRSIESNLGGVQLPAGALDSIISRFGPALLPVLRLSITGEGDLPSLKRLTDELIIPSIERADGVLRVDVFGDVDEQVLVITDADKLKDLGLSVQQISNALSGNNVSFPAGSVDDGNLSFPVRIGHEFGSINDIRSLVVGLEDGPTLGVPSFGGRLDAREIFLSDVAEVRLSTEEATRISRTNGKASLVLLVRREPKANSLEVTTRVKQELATLKGLPTEVEIVILDDEGPQVRQQLQSLQRDGLLGFILAILVVIAFLINLRPGLLKGLTLSLRPSLVIAISIPLSLVAGILLMSPFDVTLNIMSLGGLAIAIGRVVDDSIVVLENTYRHLQKGEERLEAAMAATKEVSAAIVSSTLTTVVVFLPLAFIQGIIGSFFSPFALAVSLAMIASTLVAITAVPVLGVFILRRDDFSEEEGASELQDTWLQRIYTSALIWALRRKLATLLMAVALVVGSLSLTQFIPVAFFPVGAPDFLFINMELPSGSSVARTSVEVRKVESVLDNFKEKGIVVEYQVTIGAPAGRFNALANGNSGPNIAGFFVRLSDEAPKGFGEEVRSQLGLEDDIQVTVAEDQIGNPPTDDMELNITGKDFTAVSAVARELETRLEGLEGVINLTNNVSDARNEVAIKVDPKSAAELGLTASEVARQVNQFIVGHKVSEVDLQGETMDIVVKGRSEEVDNIEKLKSLTIEGPFGRENLGAIARISVEQAPVSISRFDGERSATVTGNVTTNDPQALGQAVAARVALMELPPGVEIRTGGLFQQIQEGLQDIFLAMAIGIALVYLVMVAGLGSLRNPFIIVLSLPLAIVGAVVALFITGRTLSLPALMGFLFLIGVVVTNAIVLITFVEQLRKKGYSVYDALIEGGRVRLRPILMTAVTTIVALVPLATSSNNNAIVIGAELATVVIGGMVSSTFLTLVVVPVTYSIMHEGLPRFLRSIRPTLGRVTAMRPAHTAHQPSAGDD